MQHIIFEFFIIHFALGCSNVLVTGLISVRADQLMLSVVVGVTLRSGRSFHKSMGVSVRLSCHNKNMCKYCSFNSRGACVFLM